MPTYYEELLQAANELYKSKHYAEALAAYTHLTTLEDYPFRRHAYNGCGNAFLKLEHYGEALTAFSYVIAWDYSTPMISAYYGKGFALSRLSRWSEAKDAFTELLELNPTHVEAQSGLAEALVHLGEADEAAAGAGMAPSA